MPYIKHLTPEALDRLKQLAADINDLNAHRGVVARPVTRSELEGFSLRKIFVWADDTYKQRAALGLPEHAARDA